MVVAMCMSGAVPLSLPVPLACRCCKPVSRWLAPLVPSYAAPQRAAQVSQADFAHDLLDSVPAVTPVLQPARELGPPLVHVLAPRQVGAPLRRRDQLLPGACTVRSRKCGVQGGKPSRRTGRRLDNWIIAVARMWAVWRLARDAAVCSVGCRNAARPTHPPATARRQRAPLRCPRLRPSSPAAARGRPGRTAPPAPVLQGLRRRPSS